MKSLYRKTTRPDFRIVREMNPLVSPIVENRYKYTYSLYECHYNGKGDITSMFPVDEMRGYSRADATDFLLRMSAALLKPVVEIDGTVSEKELLPSTRALKDKMLQ